MPIRSLNDKEHKKGSVKITENHKNSTLAELRAENARLRKLLGQEIHERELIGDELQRNEETSQRLAVTSFRQAQELDLLDKVRRAIAVKLDMASLLKGVVESIVEVYGYTHVSVYMLEGDALVLKYQVGYEKVIERISIEEGVSGRVARTGVPILIEDAGKEPAFLQTMQDIQSEITVPLTDADQVVGTLSVESVYKLTQADLNVLTALSLDVSIAIGRARLYEDIQRRNSTLSALQNATLAVMRQLSLPDALQTILAQAAQLMNTSHGYIYLIQPDGTLQMVTGIGAYPKYIGLKVKQGEGVAGRVWESAEPLYVEDYASWGGKSEKFSDTPFKSVMGIPLLSGSRVEGVLGLSHLIGEGDFCSEDMDLLVRFAQLASIAIENAALYTRARQELLDRYQADKRMRESEEKYRLLIEHMPAVVYLDSADELGTNYYIAPQIENLLGYPYTIFSEHPNAWHDMILPEDYDRAVATITTTLKKGKAVEEYRLLAQDGRVVWVRDTSILVHNEAGQPVYIQGFLEDITEHKHAVEQLKKSERRLQVFFNQSLDGFFFCDFEEPIEWMHSPNKEDMLEYIIANKRFTEVNDAMLKQYGVTRERFLSMTTIDVFAHDIEQGRRLRRELFDSGSLHIETHERMSDGTPVWFEGDYVCLYDAQERITGFFGIQRDITERRRAESELRRHAQNTITMYQLSQNIHSGLDLDHVYQAAHYAAQELMPCDSFLVSLLVKDTQDVEDVYSWDNGRRWENERHSIHEGLTGYVISTGKSLFVNEWNEEHTRETGARFFGDTALETLSVLAVPLFSSSGLPFGMITVQAYLANMYTPEHEQLLFTLANQISKAIENANLFNEVQQELAERKRAERALRESEAHLEEAQRIARLGSWTWVAATDTPVWSHELYMILGGNPDEPAPSVIDQEKIYTPESTKKLQVAILKTMQTGEPYEIELECLLADGTKKWILSRGERWYDDNDELIGLRGTALEITERKLAEQALRESEERYRTLFAGMLDGVYRSTHDGKFVDVNPAMVAMFGYSSREEMLSINIKEDLYFSPEDRHSLFLDTGQEKVDEFLMKRKDGSEIWVEDHGRYIHDEHGNVIYHEGILRDITDRKRAEDALRVSEAFTKSIVENEPECVKIVGKGGILQYMNPAGLKMIEADTHEMVQGKSVYPIVSSKHRQAFIELTEKVLNGEPGTLQFEITGLKGTRRWLDTNAVPLYDEYGKVTSLLGLTRDITERKLAEDAMRATEEKYRSIFENAVEGIYQSSPDGRFYTVNPALASILGYDSPQEMIDTITDIASQVYYDTRRREDFIRELEEQGSISGFEYQMRRKDGRFVWVSENARLVRDTDGNILYYEGILEDITSRKNNEQRIDNHLKQLNALHAIDNAINSNFDLRMTLEVLLREVLAQLKVDASSVLLFNKDTHTLDYTAGRGFISKATQHTKLNAGEGFAGRVILDRRILHIPDLTKSESKLSEALSLAGENFVAYVGCPLIAKGQVMGVLEIFQRTPLNPDPDWFDFLSMISDQAAIAIENAQLFENLQRSNFELTLAYDATIEGWSRALDLRDRETEGHTQRVTNLTIKLARQMGIPDSDILHIRRGALLHDIGKMGIPDNILHKPDDLTPEEWAIMRQHTNYAYQMLTPIKYLKPALDIPRYHHEKWDGTGYPNGLSGEQIPLPARIFAVVDVWDALSSDRSYRDAWPREKVIEYIRSEAGKHFDPRVVDTFLALILEEER